MNEYNDDRQFHYIAIGDDPDNPDYVLGDNISNEKLLASIGKTIIAFTKLEETMSICFSLTLGCEPELAGIIAHALPTRERCDILFHIFSYRLGSAELIRSGKNTKHDKNLRAVEKLFDKIDRVITQRNKIVHSTWVTYNEREEKIHRIKWNKTRKTPGWPSEDYKITDTEEIEKLVNEINDINNELYLTFWQYFGSWVQERAERNEGGLQIINGEEED
ncbi:MAG TPA: hypothetical protein G4O15_01545 [Dehalococcoidia bacterium]|nr:hypothetical protein [Dehalococcoidia bacterium]